MATAPQLIEHPPAGLAGPLDGELADVIPLNPSPDERDLTYTDAVRAVPGWLGRGMLRLAGSVRDLAADKLIPRDYTGMELRNVVHNGHGHALLLSPPDPEVVANPQEAPFVALGYGLGEIFDIDSALGLHRAVAARNPGAWTVSQETKGMSHSGQTIPFAKAGCRYVETMAAENLEVLRQITNGAPTNLVGVSLRTHTNTYMAALNATANPHQQIDIQGMDMVSSPVFARQDTVPGFDNFFEPGFDQKAFQQQMEAKFKLHVAADGLRMFKNYPRSMLACSPLMLEYLIHPEKLPSRWKAISADFNTVAQGVDWSTLLMLGRVMRLNFVLGADDVLTPPQRPQINRLIERSPEGNVTYTEVPDAGHLMTACPPLVVDKLLARGLAASET